MKYIIIGLGNYGHVLAEELSALGHEVIGADVSVGRVDSLKEKIATAFVIDATDEQALSVLPLNSVDVVIVAIGENFGASIRVVALLKQKKVQHIYARAIDAVHRSVLEAFELERILTPEEDGRTRTGTVAGIRCRYGDLPRGTGLLCSQVHRSGQVHWLLCQ